MSKKKQNIARTLPMSHLSPVLPEEQRHLPVTWSQGASSSQSHSLAQPGPYVPCSHTEEQTEDSRLRIPLDPGIILWWSAVMWLTSVTASSARSCRTDAVSRRRVTGGSVHTVTLQLTQRAVETGRTGWGRGIGRIWFQDDLYGFNCSYWINNLV